MPVSTLLGGLQIARGGVEGAWLGSIVGHAHAGELRSAGRRPPGALDQSILIVLSTIL
jgi:hypothetical protein